MDNKIVMESILERILERLQLVENRVEHLETINNPASTIPGRWQNVTQNMANN